MRLAPTITPLETFGRAKHRLHRERSYIQFAHQTVKEFFQKSKFFDIDQASSLYLGEILVASILHFIKVSLHHSTADRYYIRKYLISDMFQHLRSLERCSNMAQAKMLEELDRTLASFDVEGPDGQSWCDRYIQFSFDLDGYPKLKLNVLLVKSKVLSPVLGNSAILELAIYEGLVLSVEDKLNSTKAP